MSDRRSKCAWSNCVMYIPFILSGNPNKCWPHTPDAFIITTWRLGLWATRGACNKTYFLTRTVPTRVSYCFVRADEQPVRAFKNRCKCTSWKQKIVDSTLGEKSKAAKCSADKWLINTRSCWVIEFTLGIDWATINLIQTMRKSKFSGTSIWVAKPRYSKQISSVPWPFVISRFRWI